MDNSIIAVYKEIWGAYHKKIHKMNISLIEVRRAVYSEY